MSAMADTLTFAEWLEEAMKKQGITQAELARQAGVTRAAVNGILTGARGPGVDLCNGIARALKLPPEVVFGAAGILPPVPIETQLVNQITHLATKLPDDEQQGVLEFVKLRLRLSEARGNYETKTSKRVGTPK